MPGSEPRRGWVILLVALMILACLVAALATVLYLSGSFLTPGAPTPIT